MQVRLIKGRGNLIDINAHINDKRLESKCTIIKCVSTTCFDIGSNDVAKVGKALK